MSHRLRAVFSSEAGLTVLLVSLVLCLFVIYPFVPLAYLGQLLVTLGLTVVLVSGSFSFTGQPQLKRLALILAGLSLGAHWVCNAADVHALLPWVYSSTIAFLLLVAGGILAQIRRGNRISARHIQGAIAVYLMLGLIWGLAYGMVELAYPGAFNLPEMSEAGGHMEARQHDLRNLVYFSFVTLTTLGYGDISPVGSGARTLVTVEALVGQLYLVILIARLVSLEISDSRRAGPPS